MKKSKYGGNKNGIGLYELMLVPSDVYKKAISAIKDNRVEDFYNIVGLVSTRISSRTPESNRILIIEDELALANSLERALRNRGFGVVYSADKEGLSSVENTDISLIILDLTLPDVDVLSICRILKKNKPTAHIPIIIINGNADENDIIEGLRAGADDYLGKDFSLVELAARVKAVLRTYK
ncbi:MAG: response regulator [Elusimicrobiota bacterium]